MTLIIQAALAEPPTEALMFRHITLMSHDLADYLIETEQAAKDLYYRYLLERGLMDFIAQIVVPREKVTGLRLYEGLKKFPNEVTAPAIRIEAICIEAICSTNCVRILDMIRIYLG